MAKRKTKRRARAIKASPKNPTPNATLEYQTLGDGLAAAQSAVGRGDIDGALAIIAELRGRFPGDPEPVFRAARLLQEHARTDEADQMLLEGQRRFAGNFGFVVQRAWLAHHRRDFTAAAERWAEMRDAFPDNPGGYHGGATSLREGGRIDEAEVLAAWAMQQFPDDFGIAGEHARAASARRDLATAAARWDQVVARFPDQPSAFLGAAQARREMGQLDEANAKLAEAATLFPDNAHIALERAWVAQIARDWAEAAQRWHDVQSRFPEHDVAYPMEAGALRELGRLDAADAVLAAWTERSPQQPKALIEHARFAAERKDSAEALRRWERVRAAFPDLADGYFGAAEALSSLRRETEADELLAAALDRFEATPGLLAEHAWAAYRRQAWDAAAERFARVRQRFPDEPAGYLGGAAVLAQQGRVPDAEALLELGIRQMPENPQLALERARLAVHPLGPRRDWDEALQRLERLRGRFPDFEPAYFFAMNFARDATRLDEAEAIAQDAIARFPSSRGLAVQHARIALDRNDWVDAAQRFERIKDGFPDDAAGPVGMAEALSRAGEFAAADAVLEAAMARFPAEKSPFSEYGLVAIRRNDWKAALERALAAQQRFPNEPGVAQQVFEARLRLAESDPDAIGGDGPAGAAQQGVDDPRAVMMRFESLGGSGHGCEFGLVQRKFGAEPLGLLRWADLGADAEGLIAALDTEFAGIGEPEHTELITLPTGGRNEYWTRDRRYWMAMRAFIFEDEIPYDKMYAQACRRLQYLRRKLVEDLGDDGKIFVYKNMFRDLTEDELGRLHAAVRRYGDNTLLYVRFTDVSRPNGTIDAAAPGLLVGYIDRFAFSPKNEPQGEATLSWLALCQEALRVRGDDKASTDFESADRSRKPKRAHGQSARGTQPPV